MTDVGTQFLQGISAFGATRLGRASATTFKDSGSLVSSLGDGVPSNTKPAYEQLKADVKADAELVKPIVKAIEKQTALIAKMAKDSIADANAGAFTTAEAGRIGVRIGTALIAIDEAVGIVATKLATDAGGAVNWPQREALMGIWNPWVQPFKDLGGGAGELLDSFGDQALGIPHTTEELGSVLSFDREKFRLAATLASTAERNFGALRLNETRLEAFLGFNRREFVNPSAQQKLELVERDGKWWRADEAVYGLRIFTLIRPGLQNDKLLKKVMPGSAEPTTIKPTAITLDSVDGLYLGDGEGAANERVVLPVQFNFPAVEIRELALGIVRNPAKEVSGLELTSVIATKFGTAVGMQVEGAGATIALDGKPPNPAIFPWDVSPRWPDAIGLRIEAGPVKGGGYIQRKVRTYGSGAQKQELVEFGGVIQLEILKVGVSAVVVLSPDPFSLVVVMGVRFPTAIELSFGFTLNGIGGMLALDRRVDTTELIKGMRSHFIDRVLFPSDPVAEAPKLLDQVAHVFPPQKGGFVVGPIVELGWGSQAKIVEAKLGVILALPDPKLILLGAVRIRAPTKATPLTDFRCEVYGEISADRLLIVANLSQSEVAGISVTGELGLLIQWGGGGAFALSVGGFNPRYKEAPEPLKELERLTINISPPGIVKIVVKAYFAVTPGAVMAGIRGDLNADVGVASAHAWLQLDMIFFWAPRFGFAIDLDLGISIEVFGHSFASISFKGALEGTTPWKLEGKATVDVWFLPTYHFDLGPFSWGDDPPPIEAVKSPLALVRGGLDEKEAWKAVLPHDGDQLAKLGRVDEPGLVAHPLAALEVTQSRLPLETHIDRIGSAGVSANRVAIGLARTSAGPVGAVSTVTAPFAPGQFQALEGEALLARSGFDDLPSGCRIGAATTPVHGGSEKRDVHWRTFVRDEDVPPTPQTFDSRMFSAVIASLSPASRAFGERQNPYVSRAQKVDPRPATGISILPPGSATMHFADDGKDALADLGVLTASEAGRVADAVRQSGAGAVVAVAVGAMR